MRVAITIWNGRVSPVFDVSRAIIILDIQNKVVVKRNEKRLALEDPMSRINYLAGLNVHTLICGAASQPIIGMLKAYGIQVVSFISGEVDTVIAAYLKGDLPNPSMAMPGCGGGGRRKRLRRGRRGG